MIAKGLLLLVLTVDCLADSTISPQTHHQFDGHCNPRNRINCGVAKCTENLLSRALPNFDMNELTGPYNYAYSTSLYSSKCAIGDVYENSDTGLSAYALLLDKFGGHSQFFNFSSNKDGTIDETLISDDGDFVYNFKLVPLGWDGDTGVFYYGRCSADGEGETESRSIVVSQSNDKIYKARKVAYNFAKLDSASSYQGKKLKRYRPCKF
uniref:Uncharacterized protein n=1 Tax=Clastoptera arizonana TaxID=38151 RepID=A0A1B6EAE9_9HEMI